MERMTAEQFRNLKTKKRAKFISNIKKTPDGVFQSEWELKRWGDLKMLSLAGEISDLKKQVDYPLAVNGVKITTYRADFQYVDTLGNIIVEDTKSEATLKLEAFQMKKALMLALYGISIKIILKPSFKKKKKKSYGKQK